MARCREQSGYVVPILLSRSSLGGDYGQHNVHWRIRKGHYLEATATRHDNFLFFKADPDACFDLTTYTAVKFDMQAPKGSDSKFTLTQKDASCENRILDGDSVYHSISKFAEMDGTKKTVVMPLAEYSKRSKDGKPFDFVHFKDFTFVDMTPGAKFKISNIWLVGNCKNGQQPQKKQENEVKGDKNEEKNKNEGNAGEKPQQANQPDAAKPPAPAANDAAPPPAAEDANKPTEAPAQEAPATEANSFAPSLYEFAWTGLTGLAAALFL